MLLPPPASDTLAEDGIREYDRNPYAFYAGSREIGIGGTYEGPLHPKTLVIGVAHDGVARAYPIDASPMFYFAWQKFNPDTDVWGTADGG